MAMQPLATRVSRQGELAVIALAGDVDGAADTTLTAAFDEAVAGSPARLLLDFGDVVYINSTGIALIVGLLGRARAERIDLAACGLLDHYREIFEITRLSDFMRIFPDERAAVADAAPGTTEEVTG